MRVSNICAAPALGAELLHRLQWVLLARAPQLLPNHAQNGTWPQQRERWLSAGAAWHISNYTVSLHFGQTGWHMKTKAFHKNDCSETESERELLLCLLRKWREPGGVGIAWDRGKPAKGPALSGSRWISAARVRSRWARRLQSQCLLVPVNNYFFIDDGSCVTLWTCN